MSNLNRFRKAQKFEENGLAEAKKEMQRGYKTGHWIWYILPQLEILGVSDTAKEYGIADFDEACDYLRDSMLCQNYLEIITIIEKQLSQNPALSLSYLMGSDGDAYKLVSSLTLFQGAATFLMSTENDDENQFSKVKTCCDNIFTLIKGQYSHCPTTQAFFPAGLKSKPAIFTSNPDVAINVAEKKKTVVLRSEPAILIPDPEITPSAVKKTKPSDSIITTGTVPATFFVTPVPEQKNKLALKVEPVVNPDPIKSSSQLIPQLDDYIQTRKNEWSFHYNFLGIIALIYLIQDKINGTDYFYSKSREVKISAATKLKQRLDPTGIESNISLTKAEKEALTEGRLGDLVSPYGDLDTLIRNAAENPSDENKTEITP